MQNLLTNIAYRNDISVPDKGSIEQMDFTNANGFGPTGFIYKNFSSDHPYDAPFASNTASPYSYPNKSGYVTDYSTTNFRVSFLNCLSTEFSMEEVSYGSYNNYYYKSNFNVIRGYLTIRKNIINSTQVLGDKNGTLYWNIQTSDLDTTVIDDYFSLQNSVKSNVGLKLDIGQSSSVSSGIIFNNTNGTEIKSIAITKDMNISGYGGSGGAANLSCEIIIQYSTVAFPVSSRTNRLPNTVVLSTTTPENGETVYIDSFNFTLFS
jgi:hypothetical protein